jgi:hypothetical protein
MPLHDAAWPFCFRGHTDKKGPGGGATVEGVRQTRYRIGKNSLSTA